MKKILLDEKKNYYKANLHCHTTYSDGQMTVEEIKEHYKKNGYSVVAYTDHEHLIDNSNLNDDEFLAITSCEVAIKEFEDLSTLIKTDMKVAHLNFYAKDPKNIDTPCYNSAYDHFLKDAIKDKIVHTCGEYERKYSHAKINDMIKTANEKGFLVSYNHPGWSLENATDYLNYEGLWAVEVYNNECNVSGLEAYETNVYDDILRQGKKIACTATDDNHIMESTCGGYVMINADKLDYKTIINALENHDFYSSTGPIIKSLWVEDNKAYLTYEKGEYAIMRSNTRKAKKIIAKNSDGENKVEFQLNPEKEKYIRFEVLDKFGKRAMTCAYFMEDLLK